MNVFSRALAGTMALLVITGLQVKAQNAVETEVELNKAMQKALVAEYQYPEDLVESVVKDKFEKGSFGKGDRKKGYRVYGEIIWPEVASNDKIDVWMDTDERKGKTTLTILVSKGYNNFISSATDPAIVENIKGFMNNLNAEIYAMDLSKKIEEQEKVIKSLTKQHEDVKENRERLERDKKKLEEEIQDQLKAEEKYASEAESEKSRLEQLRSQAGR